MKRHSDDEAQRKALYNKIIGLGENSIKKSYYPELQHKIIELEKINVKLALEVVERQRAEDEIKKSYENQTVINSILKLSLQDIPLDELFNIVIDTILSLSWLSTEGKASFFFVEDVPNVLVLKAENGFPNQIRTHCANVPFGRCVCGLAASSREIQFASHCDERHSIRYDNMHPHGHYSVPILLENRSIGVICVYLPHGHHYDPKEVEVLASVANTLAGIIQRKMITAQKNKLQSQLRQSQKMEAIGTLAGGIAHDFNNILSPIFGYAELATYHTHDPVSLQRDLEQILQSAERAKELVKQILTFSRRSDQELKPLRVQLILKEVLKLLRSSLPTTIEIQQDINPDCEPIVADPTQIHQVVMNLCTNAYHAMREAGGILAISLVSMELSPEDVDSKVNLQSGSYLKLTISDTGSGMTKDILERIFEPYYTTKVKGDGTGLGLAVVHGIVNNLKGDITVYSKPGEGTTFNVFMPIVAAISATAQKQVMSPLPTGNEKILLVDDDEAIANMTKELIEQFGYKVTALTNSLETLHTFEKDPNHFDLVITDMTMPNITGAELSKRILAIRPDMPIIICTGFSELMNEEKAKAIGIRDYVIKPFLKADLARSIRKTLDDF